MSRLVAVGLTVLACAGLASVPARAHGASKGLHLHVTPDTAAPGGEVTIEADAALPIVRMRIAFVGVEPTEIRPKEPTKTSIVKLRVPAGVKSATINVSAEVEAAGGKTLRAGAVVKIRIGS